MTTQQTHHNLNLSHSALLEGLRAHLQPLTGDARQYDGLLALIGGYATTTPASAPVPDRLLRD